MKSLRGITVLLTMLMLVSKILGVIREIVFARFFGVSLMMDAYVIANVLPTTIGNVVQACFDTTFVPVFNEYVIREEKEEANRLLSAAFSLLVLFLIIVVAISFISAPYIISLLAPGFNTEAQLLSVYLTRIMLPMVMLFGLLGLASAMQQVHGKFLLPTGSLIFNNVVVILITILFANQMGIVAAAAACLIAQIVQFMVQVPSVLKCGYRPRLIGTAFHHPGIIKAGRLMIPVMIGIAATNINLMVDRILASTLTEGSVSALNFASRINISLLGLMVAPITIVIFPTLSQHVLKGEPDLFKQRLNSSIKLITFLIVPVAVIMSVFRLPIVQVIFEGGKFDSTASMATAYALLFFAFGLIGMALTDLLNRAFYAHENTRVPALVTTIVVTVNIILNLVLIKPLMLGGIALASAISSNLGALILYLLLQKKIGDIGTSTILVSVGKAIFASSIMAIIAWVTYTSLIYRGTSGSLGLAMTLGVGAVVYLVTAFGLKCEELNFFFHAIRAKLKLSVSFRGVDR